MRGKTDGDAIYPVGLSPANSLAAFGWRMS
jgi:hypothetical protein